MLSLIVGKVALVILVATVPITGTVLTQPNSKVSVPRCQEDAVLVGTGQFDNGVWSGYECGPAVDDFEGYRADDQS